MSLPLFCNFHGTINLQASAFSLHTADTVISVAAATLLEVGSSYIPHTLPTTTVYIFVPTASVALTRINFPPMPQHHCSLITREMEAND